MSHGENQLSQRNIDKIARQRDGVSTDSGW